MFNVGLYPDDAREHGVVLDVSIDKFLAVFGQGCFAVNLPIVLQVGYIASRQGSDGAAPLRSTSSPAPAPSPARRPHHHRRSPRSPDLHRPAPKSANNNSAKKKCRRRPAAAAPPSRPVQVGLLAERAGTGAASRARVGAARSVNAHRMSTTPGAGRDRPGSSPNNIKRKSATRPQRAPRLARARDEIRLNLVTAGSLWVSNTFTISRLLHRIYLR